MGQKVPVIVGPGVLTFSGMTDLRIHRGLDLSFRCRDRDATLYLCVGNEDNRVKVSGTNPRTRQAAVLAAIDELANWSASISLWMVAEKTGQVIARTPAKAWTTHVQPYTGPLTIDGFAAAKPALTYPGNGDGRLLSPRINDRYYFIYAGYLETTKSMRGFDCTSFPMALFELDALPAPGYGKQLCDAAGAEKCDLEQIKSAELHQRFVDDSIPVGKYILFSEGHVMLYDSDVNVLHEFNYGGYRSTPAAERDLPAKHGLWWMRKLGVERYPAFM